MEWRVNIWDFIIAWLIWSGIVTIGRYGVWLLQFYTNIEIGKFLGIAIAIVTGLIGCIFRYKFILWRNKRKCLMVVREST